MRNIALGSRLRERAYEAIKEAILKLELTPGQSVNEAELANQLNVSRTPIRDALLQLQSEGFVVIQPFRGAFVAELTAQDILDIFSLRELLEVSAVRAATQKFTNEEIALMEGLMAQIEETSERGSLSDYSLLTDQFHRQIIEKVGNRRLVQVLDNLGDHLKRLRTMALQVRQTRDFVEDYRSILEGIRSRNPSSAEKALKTHLNRVLRTLVANPPQL